MRIKLVKEGEVQGVCPGVHHTWNIETSRRGERPVGNRERDRLTRAMSKVSSVSDRPDASDKGNQGLHELEAHYCVAWGVV